MNIINYHKIFSTMMGRSLFLTRFPRCMRAGYVNHHMKKYFQLSLVAQAVTIICFVFFCYQADQAMSKDGIGNLELWQQYSVVASLSLYSGILLWVATVLFAAFHRAFNSKHAQLSVGAPPLLLIAGWVSLYIYV